MTHHCKSCGAPIIVIAGPTGVKTFPHLAHLVVTLFTCGLWIPVWFLAYICRNRMKYA